MPRSLGMTSSRGWGARLRRFASQTVLFVKIYNRLIRFFNKLNRAKSQQETNSGDFNGQWQNLLDKAKQVIPGGNMMLSKSKRAEMFLPDHWRLVPTPLRYSHSKVDEAVMRNRMRGQYEHF